MRDRIFNALKESPEDPRAVFERFKSGIETPETASAPASK